MNQLEKLIGKKIKDIQYDFGYQKIRIIFENDDVLEVNSYSPSFSDCNDGFEVYMNNLEVGSFHTWRK